MYVPPAFRIEDLGRIADFVRRYSFATLVTNDGGVPFASHLPMLYRAEPEGLGRFESHLARANPQWRNFASDGEALAIFHGPHAYISPSWYEAKLAVPTWNYAVVHAYGAPKIIDDRDRIAGLLRETIETFKAGFEKPWPGDLPDDYREKMMQGIVAFELRVTRFEGKYKLGQNRSEADIRGVFDGLTRTGDPESRAVAQFMSAEKILPSPGSK